MYHLELSKFPNKMARFNLSEREMLAIVLPWARGEWVEFGERKWNTHESRITILDGPQIPVQRLRVGHGWRLAQRQSEDVTEQVLSSARQIALPGSTPAGATPSVAPDAMPPPDAVSPAGGVAPGGAPQPPEPATEGAGAAEEDLLAAAPGSAPQPPASASAPEGEEDLLADSLGLQLLALLDRGPAGLAAVWELAMARLPGRPAGESLALAERAMRSLLRSRLVVLMRPVAGDGADQTGAHGEEVDGADVDVLLQSPASWAERDHPQVLITRAP